MSRRPQQGEIWLADLNPPVGHEQAGPPRPVLVVSGAVMNLAPYGLSLVVPLSSKIKKLPGHVLLPSVQSGLRADSEIMCEHLRSISHERFRTETPLAVVPDPVLRDVVKQIGFLLEPRVVPSPRVTAASRPHSPSGTPDSGPPAYNEGGHTALAGG